MRRWMWVAWVGLMAGRLCCAAEASDATLWGDVERLRAKIDALRVAGQAPAAVAACEAFLNAHPDSGYVTASAIDLVYAMANKEFAEPAKRRELVQRIVDSFERCPQYYTWASCELGVSWLWVPGLEHDPTRAETVLATAAAKVKGRIPAWFSAYPSLLVQLANARRLQGKLEAAEAGLKEALLANPRVFTTPDFILCWSEFAKTRNDPEALAAAAKLGYVLCDYTTEDLKKAIDTCSAALAAKGGPGLGLAFARCQDDAKADNPLRGVKLADLGDPAKLLAAAGGDAQGQLNVLLYAGRLKEATALAKQQLTRAAATDPHAVADALRNLARCFKARDLNLVRANRLLDYHRTGAGPDPLPELEAELK